MKEMDYRERWPYLRKRETLKESSPSETQWMMGRNESWHNKGRRRGKYEVQGAKVHETRPPCSHPTSTHLPQHITHYTTPHIEHADNTKNSWRLRNHIRLITFPSPYLNTRKNPTHPHTTHPPQQTNPQDSSLFSRLFFPPLLKK